MSNVLAKDVFVQNKPRNVIISIRPEYAFKIISGEKVVELRRRFPVENIAGGTALIYASSPIKKIIGHAVIQEVKKMPIDELWDSFYKEACVSKEFFYAYFDGVSEGFALIMQKPAELNEPVDMKRLKEEFLLSVPQSYRYAPDSVMGCVAI